MASRHPALVPLSREHHDALSLAFRLHHPAPPGPITPVTPASTAASRAGEARAFFATRLVPHFRAEEDVLFPALDAALLAGDPLRALIDALRAEHREMDALVGALDPHGASPELERRLTAFADLLERHVRSEERVLFAAFPRLVSEVEAARIGEAIERARGETP